MPANVLETSRKFIEIRKITTIYLEIEGNLNKNE
jgi:hypothetical protein